jgi:DNA-binding NtrC family response regulator
LCAPANSRFSVESTGAASHEIVLGASAAFQDAVDCMQKGAADYLASAASWFIS